tara:strand:+ start:27985 stop:28551 length:567 start_codon:yes stop_codon:yes gene_type:complete
MNQNLISRYLRELKDILPIEKIRLYKDEINIQIRLDDLSNVLIFLKHHNNCQYKSLTHIAGVDYLQRDKRFEVIYELLSIRYNSRIRVKITLSQLELVESCEKIYPGANWFECEVFDMFGIFFSSHSNLRRLLTDYGFEGYPLRKDFPLSGFVELKYNDKQKRIVSEYLELAQEYRTFDFITPWNKNK